MIEKGWAQSYVVRDSGGGGRTKCVGNMPTSKRKSVGVPDLPSSQLKLNQEDSPPLPPQPRGSRVNYITPA